MEKKLIITIAGLNYVDDLVSEEDLIINHDYRKVKLDGEKEEVLHTIGFLDLMTKDKEKWGLLSQKVEELHEREKKEKGKPLRKKEDKNEKKIKVLRSDLRNVLMIGSLENFFGHINYEQNVDVLYHLHDIFKDAINNSIKQKNIQIIPIKENEYKIYVVNDPKKFHEEKENRKKQINEFTSAFLEILKQSILFIKDLIELKKANFSPIGNLVEKFRTLFIPIAIMFRSKRKDTYNNPHTILQTIRNSAEKIGRMSEEKSSSKEKDSKKICLCDNCKSNSYHCLPISECQHKVCKECIEREIFKKIDEYPSIFQCPVGGCGSILKDIDIQNIFQLNPEKIKYCLCNLKHITKCGICKKNPCEKTFPICKNDYDILKKKHKSSFLNNMLLREQIIFLPALKEILLQQKADSLLQVQKGRTCYLCGSSRGEPIHSGCSLLVCKLHQNLAAVQIFENELKCIRCGQDATRFVDEVSHKPVDES